MVLMESNAKLPPGANAPNFSLRGIDGNSYSLSSFRGAKALLVIFTCNHCPYAKAKTPEMVRLHSKFANQGLRIVAINSNDASQYQDDSFENMKLFAKANGMEFPYLWDETQAVARAYGAACTPDPFLFDSDFKLVYHGRLDNAPNPDGKAAEFEMEKAISCVLSGREIDWQSKPSMGCSIKWKRI